MKTRYLNQFALLSAAVTTLTFQEAKAQEVQLIVDSINAYSVNTGKVYFSLVGSNGQGLSVQMPQIHPPGYDHWDFSPGTVQGPITLWEGYLGANQKGNFILTVRESYSDPLSFIENVFQAAVGVVMVSLGNTSSGLTQIASAGVNFVNNLKGSDQNVGAIAMQTQLINGVLSSQFTNVKDTLNESSSANSYEFLAEGGGGQYDVKLHLQYLTGAQLPKIVSFNTPTLCLDVPGFSTADMVQVQQYACNGGPNQRWMLLSTMPSDRADNPITIVSANSGKCLDVRGASQTDGAAIQQYTCHGGTDQQFWWDSHGVLLPSGNYMIQNVNSARCIDVPGLSHSSGTLIQQYACEDVRPPHTYPPNQMWSLSLK